MMGSAFPPEAGGLGAVRGGVALATACLLALAQASWADGRAETGPDAEQVAEAAAQETTDATEVSAWVVREVADPCANLRRDADPLEAPIDCLPPGTIVRLLSSSGAWARVSLPSGLEGLMLASYLRPVSETAVPADSGEEVAAEPAQADEPQQEPEPAEGTLYESLGVVGEEEPPEPASGAEYVIRAGDELSVKFFLSPELNEELIVRPDGRISLQLIPEVVAAGRTPRELTALLKEMYAAELSRPVITVIVRSFTAHRVFVDGAVDRPTQLELVGELTVMQSIAQAGGFMPTARESEVILIRRGDDGRPVLIPLNVRDIRRGESSSRDLTLLPYDIVYVPTTRIANVNKWIDQYIRQNIPVSFGFRLEISN